MNSRLSFSVLACVALAQAQTPDQPMINTPTSVVQCLPSLISFSGGSPPYTISAIPGGQPGAAPLADLGSQSGSSFTWKANIPAGTSITLQIRDSRGVINYSQAVTIQPSSDSSCLSGGSQPSPTGPSAPVTTGTSSTPPPSPGSPAPGPAAGNNTSAPATPANNNSTSGARSNATTPATGAANTSSSSSPSSSNNQTKSPSVFTPPTSTSLTNSSSAPTNAQNSAAPGSSVHSQGLFAGLAIAGVVMSIFA